jgi:hypothetical protein
MKFLAVPQIILVLAIVLFSWTLADVKAHHVPPDPVLNGSIWLDSNPPGAGMEFTLLILSTVVFIIGWSQWLYRIKGASLQIILSWVMMVISAILVVRASTINEYGEIFYLAYMILALSLAVCAIGIWQIITSFIDNLKARLIKNQ